MVDTCKLRLALATISTLYSCMDTGIINRDLSPPGAETNQMLDLNKNSPILLSSVIDGYVSSTRRIADSKMRYDICM